MMIRFERTDEMLLMYKTYLMVSKDTKVNTNRFVESGKIMILLSSKN